MKGTNMQDIAVDTIVAKPGQKAQGYLTVGEMQDGNPIRIPAAIVNGVEDGPVLYLQAASDGDELNGIAVIQEILRQIEPYQLRGGIIAVPLVNYHAFHAKRTSSPVDGKKMNRCFPGKADGSSSERIAHELFNRAIKQADYCIDLHQGGVNPMIDEVRVRVGKEDSQHDACLELARVFGIGYILDQKGPDGQLARAAPAEGIPTIDPELGGCHGWDDKSIAKGIVGVKNILKHYDFIEGEPVIPGKQIVVDSFTKVMSNRGGFVRYLAQLYDHIEADQPIAEILDVFGDLVEIIKAPKPGIFWGKNLYPMVASGESIATIGINVKYI
ncbi:MAG: succinylglutamate desuccinylase/aspartoacylase family protein [Candidatus Poribacteria bacterium]